MLLIALGLGFWLVTLNQQALAQEKPYQVVAVGDIACGPADSQYRKGLGTPENCRMKYTAGLIPSQTAAILALGDLQYPKGILKDFRAAYDLSWGRFKAITYPIPGNHEYSSDGAKGYYDYFGSRAGDRSKGYYSFDLGNWHLVALNSNCDEVGGCQSGSPQERWLKNDLANSTGQCTLAYWHHPRFSSGKHGSDTATEGLWKALVEAKAELVLVGHDHTYERFAPMDALGARSDAGVVQMVVGTGGKSLYGFDEPLTGSLVRYNQGFGVLQLKLYPDRLDYRFVAEPPAAFSDSGTIYCR